MSENEAPFRPRWPYPRLLAHRGGGALAPENTLSGLRLARRLGYVGVEFDVKPTQDAIPVLMHDDTVDRTTSGEGPLTAIALAMLAELDAGRGFAPAFAGERVPTLETAARLCQALGLWANVEIKPCPGRDTETGAIVGRAAATLWAGAATPPLLSSFSAPALAAARAAAPELPRGLLVEDVPADWLEALAKLDCVALHVQHDQVTSDLVEAVHGAGYGMLCYTVNHPERAAFLYRLGVDCVVTDRLDLLDPHADDCS